MFDPASISGTSIDLLSVDVGIEDLTGVSHETEAKMVGFAMSKGADLSCEF